MCWKVFSINLAAECWLLLAGYCTLSMHRSCEALFYRHEYDQSVLIGILEDNNLDWNKLMVKILQSNKCFWSASKGKIFLYTSSWILLFFCFILFNESPPHLIKKGFTLCQRLAKDTSKVELHPPAPCASSFMWEVMLFLCYIAPLLPPV